MSKKYISASDSLRSGQLDRMVAKIKDRGSPMTPDPKPVTIRLKGKAYKELQLAVLRRDDFTCQKCNRHTLAPPHHVKLLSRGGSDEMSNMVTLCVLCHSKEHR